MTQTVTLTLSPRPGPCLKQVVTATLVAQDGRRFIGTNHILNTPTDGCPRKGLPSGVGYELCRDVCQQPAHAEVNAIRAAGDAARGSTIYVEGHTFACSGCLRAAAVLGADIVIGAPPAVTE